VAAAAAGRAVLAKNEPSRFEKVPARGVGAAARHFLVRCLGSTKGGSGRAYRVR
jgi:hypothetical protein